MGDGPATGLPLAEIFCYNARAAMITCYPEQVKSVRCLLFWAVLAWLTCGTLAAPESVQLHYQLVNNFPVKYVTVNLNDPDVVVTPVAARSFPTGLEGWGSFLKRLQPDAAINGTYFCLRSYMPVGDVAIDGGLVYRGVVGTALCLTPDNRVMLRPGPHQAKPDWTGFQSVLCAGPRLLTNGQLTINARAEGFRDPRVLGSAPRSAVALRRDRVLILLTIEADISLTNLAYVCQHLDAVEAMALDGGNSSGLYADGRTVTTPGRGLSNILAVYSSRARFREVANQIKPSGLAVLARLLPSSQSIVQLPAGAEMPLPSAGTGAAAPTSISAPPVRLVKPAADTSLRGTIAIAAEVPPGTAVNWIALRINGHLTAMSNHWPFEYQWDSTRDANGDYTLEVSAWSEEHALLGKDIRKVRIENGTVTAMK
jgi:hypothetical protein